MGGNNKYFGKFWVCELTITSGFKIIHIYKSPLEISYPYKSNSSLPNNDFIPEDFVPQPFNHQVNLPYLLLP